jgi:hypothetical protein
MEGVAQLTKLPWVVAGGTAQDVAPAVRPQLAEGWHLALIDRPQSGPANVPKDQLPYAPAA